jgi:hypothetical protein
MSTVNINNTDNQVTAVNANQSIIITDNGSTAHTSVTITQPVTSVVLVNTPGPQGAPGTGGGGTINTSSFVTTSSFNAFTGSYNTGSFTGSFTGSLFGTASWAFSSSQALTASYVANVVTFPYTGSAIITGSLIVTGSINATSITSSLFGTASWAQSASVAISSSRAITASYALGGSGSFSGDFTGFLNGTANNASQAASVYIFDSFPPSPPFTIQLAATRSPGNSFQPLYITSSRLQYDVATDVLSTTASYALNVKNLNTSSLATTGSNTFIGDQFITGSVYITGSLNADSQVYEVSFLDRSSTPYPPGDNIIELDQDLITNLNYTRNTNTINVNSSGLYKMYAQFFFQDNGSSNIEMAMFINNNPYKAFYLGDAKTLTTLSFNFSCIANLNANDNIQFHINGGANGFKLITLSPLYNVTCSYMTIEKLN